MAIERQRMLRFSMTASRPLLAGLALLLSGCANREQSFLTPDGPISSLQLHHLLLITLVTLIVVTPVLVGVPLLAWRYRYGNTKARYTPDWDFSTALEYPMWLIPAAIVAVLGVYLWIDTHKLDPYRAIAATRPPLRVQVVGLDWKWLFIYPAYHIATVGELAFPQDRPLSIRLTSDTVMQSFMIPALGGQIYAMPGMTTQLNLQADKCGRFDGMNTQYNGDGFHAQHFQAVAMPTAKFDAWVRTVQQHGAALNAKTYRVLGENSTPAQVHRRFGDAAMPGGITFFNDTLPGLFGKIVKHYHAGTAIPPMQQPGSTSYDARTAEK